MNPHTIYFGGSRSCSPSQTLGVVVQAVIQSGKSVHVGCCVGADALVITSALLQNPLSLVVFAISAASGQGACSLTSSLPPIAEQKGSSVHWLAGGGLQVPLSARLISRSLKAAQGCSAAVFFQPGQGSLRVAAQLVGQMPVYVFTNSIATPPAQIPNQAGTWGTAQFMGFRCWQWFPAQQSLF